MARKKIINIFKTGETLTSQFLTGLTTPLVTGEIAVVANDNDAILVTKDNDEHLIEFASKNYVGNFLPIGNTGDSETAVTYHGLKNALIEDEFAISKAIAQHNDSAGFDEFGHIAPELSANSLTEAILALREDTESEISDVLDSVEDLASDVHDIQESLEGYLPIGDPSDSETAVTYNGLKNALIEDELAISKAIAQHNNSAGFDEFGHIAPELSANSLTEAILALRDNTENEFSEVRGELTGLSEEINDVRDDLDTLSDEIDEKLNNYLLIGESGDSETAQTYYGVSKRIENNELVVSNALIQHNISAGFGSNGESLLPEGISLTDAILELSAKTVDLSDYYTKSETDEAIDAAIIEAGAVDSGVVKTMIESYGYITGVDLTNYYTKDETYDKAETTGVVDTIVEQALNDYYTKDETEDTVRDIVESYGYITGVDLTNYYTKDETYDKAGTTGVVDTMIEQALDDYYTKSETSGIVKTAVDERVDELIDGAPEALDTLREIAEAVTGESGTIITLIETVTHKLEEVSVNGKVLNTGNTAITLDGGDILNGADVTYSGATFAPASSSITETLNSFAKEIVEDELAISKAFKTLNESAGFGEDGKPVPELGAESLTEAILDLQSAIAVDKTGKDIENGEAVEYSGTTLAPSESSITDTINALFKEVIDNEATVSSSLNDLDMRVDEKSTVMFVPSQTSGLPIGVLTINDVDIPLYAQEGGTDPDEVQAIVDASLVPYYNSAQTESAIDDAINEALVGYLPMGDVNDSETAQTYYGVSNRIENNEQVVAGVMTLFKNSAGFDSNGRSILPSGMSLTDAILALSANTGTTEDYLPIGESGDSDTAVTYHGLKNALIEDELAISKAILKLNESAGFDENGSSTLPLGMSLSEAITGKQDTISDIAIIRNNAASGKTAYDSLSAYSLTNHTHSNYTTSADVATQISNAISVEQVLTGGVPSAILTIGGVDTTIYTLQGGGGGGSYGPGSGISIDSNNVISLSQAAQNGITSGTSAYTLINGHAADTDIHVTASDKTTWSAKQNSIDDLGTIRSNAASGASAYTNAITGVTVNGTSVVSNKVAAIPTASTSVFGVVKTGDFLTNTNGTISVTTGTNATSVAVGNHSHANYATTSTTTSINDTLTAHTSDTSIHFTTGDVATQIADAISGKQDTLISGTNIKTINNISLLGSGNITIEGGGTGSSIQVENVLTSTSTTNALSAAMGKSLNDSLSTHTADTSIHFTTGAIKTQIENYHYTTSADVNTQIANSITGKQDTISDLATIRNNAASGASAYTTVNTHTANTDMHVTAADKTNWNNKQNAISDLATIRNNAASGASAYTNAVTGVTVNGTSVVSNKVAAIPTASTSAFGVVKTGDFLTNANGTISVTTGTNANSVAVGNHTHAEYYTSAQTYTKTEVDNAIEAAIPEIGDDEQFLTFIHDDFSNIFSDQTYAQLAVGWINDNTGKAETLTATMVPLFFSTADTNATIGVLSKVRVDEMFEDYVTSAALQSNYSTSAESDQRYWMRTERVNSAITSYSAETLDNTAAKVYGDYEVLRINLKGDSLGINQGQLQIKQSGITKFQIDEGGRVGVGTITNGLNADLDVNNNALVRGKVAIGYGHEDILFTTGDTQLEINGSGHLTEDLTVGGNIQDENGVKYVKVETLTQADYNSLAVKDSNTLYIIVGN